MSQRLNSLFATSLELRQLAGKAKQFLTLQQIYEQAVPPALRGASRVIRCEQQTLTLGADHSAAAAKLRQMAPDLQKHLQKHGYEVTVIQVRVQVSHQMPVSTAAKPVLSASGKQQLSELADTLPDSPLRRALRGLIRTSQN